MGRNTQVHNPFMGNFNYSPRPLTDREKQVLDLIVIGAYNAEIASQLGISVKTVEAHVARIMAKAQLDRRVLLALWWHGRETECTSST